MHPLNNTITALASKQTVFFDTRIKSLEQKYAWPIDF